MTAYKGDSYRELTLEVRQRISEQIKRRGWTQKSLSKELGRTPGWLSRLLKGGLAMNCQDLLRIARILRIQPALLMPHWDDIPQGEIPEDEIIAIEINKYLPDSVLQRLVEMRKQESKK